MTLIIHDRPVPPEWESALREISPIREEVSWLAFRFHPDFERWVVYECVPIRYVDDNELIADLGGADPESEEGKDVLVSRYQQKMFREHRVHARPCWIIQGKNGGNKVEFSESDKELCRAYGLPTEPPKPGELPYAPFDDKAKAQLAAMNKLNALKNSVQEFKRRFGTIEGQKREKREDLRRARFEYVKHINLQFEEPAEHFIKAANAGELDGHRRTETDWQKLDEQSDEKYIETGRF